MKELELEELMTITIHVKVNNKTISIDILPIKPGTETCDKDCPFDVNECMFYSKCKPYGSFSKKHLMFKGKFWYKGEQNIGVLCSNLVNLAGFSIHEARLTKESMLKLNDVLKLVTDQKTTEEDLKILAKLKNKLSSDTKKENNELELDILL